MPSLPPDPFLLDISIIHNYFPLQAEYVAKLPAVKAIDRLKLHPKVTFFIGENGTGKSTLLEAIAVADGFNAEGGTRGFSFETRASHADLYKWIRLGRGSRGKRRNDGFFMRAESFYNVATEIENLDAVPGARPGFLELYGGSYHKKSHGEAILSLITNRLRGEGLYLFDEPEAALSPQRQLVFLAAMHGLIERNSQFIIATHSPIIMAYPDATIYEFSAAGVREVAYRETEHFRVTHAFLTRTEQMLKELMSDDS